MGVFAVDLTTTPVLLGVAAAALAALFAVWLIPKRQARHWVALRTSDYGIDEIAEEIAAVIHGVDAGTGEARNG